MHAQVSCPKGSPLTTITGYVFAPNSIDPLPNVVVYIPNAPVAALNAGVECPAVGTPPLGNPLVGTTTGADGKFILSNVPVGTQIPLVIQSGKWRRQVTVPGTVQCADTAFSTRFPQNSSEGDIPKIAIVSGSVDSVECVLRKVGISDLEFTDPTASGRINFYLGGGVAADAGASLSSSTPVENDLMGDPTNAKLHQYDVLMLPCEGDSKSHQSNTELANLIDFANSGGRVYSSHYAYLWMYDNPPFDTVVNWTGGPSGTHSDGPATVDTTFSEGQTLSQWLVDVGASTTPGQIDISEIKHDFNGVNPPTQSWLTLNSNNHPVMQFVFDTPVATATVKPANQCGRVLYNEYHVETPINNKGSSNGVTFPAECDSATTAMTPQEKLLEFSLFELTDDGAQATLAPTTQDFGSVPAGFPSAAFPFIWTNNSTFAATVSILSVTGDYAITSAPCGTVGPGGSCNITVVFTPTAVGTRTGTLSVGAGATTLTAALTGTGVPDLTSSTTALAFGNVDVGNFLSKQIIITSNAPGPIAFPAISVAGDYSQTTTCGSIIQANATCIITVTFQPTTTGPLNGTLLIASYSNLTTQLTGNGVDFSIALSPTSGSVVAGESVSTSATVNPIAGFASSVTLTCSTNGTASTCIPSLAAFVPAAAVTTAIPITTTSEFVIIGYGASLGGTGLLSLIALASGWLLWMKRKSVGRFARLSLMLCFLAASSLFLSGCSGKLPAKNASYTAPGDYTYTVTASDGFLTHSATYSLHVTAK